MNSVMGDSTKSEATTPPSATSKAWTVAGMAACLVVIVGIMVAFYNYPWPGGPPSTGEFVAFFLRELLLIGALVVAVFIAAGSRVWRAIKPDAADSGHAP